MYYYYKVPVVALELDNIVLKNLSKNCQASILYRKGKNLVEVSGRESSQSNFFPSLVRGYWQQKKRYL